MPGKTYCFSKCTVSVTAKHAGIKLSFTIIIHFIGFVNY